MKFANILKLLSPRKPQPQPAQAQAALGDKRKPVAPFTRGNGLRPAKETVESVLGAAHRRVAAGKALPQRTPAQLERLARQAALMQARKRQQEMGIGPALQERIVDAQRDGDKVLRRMIRTPIDMRPKRSDGD